MVGVVLFSNVAPDNFAVFDRAFLTLFYVTAGDPWPATLPKVHHSISICTVNLFRFMAYHIGERTIFSPS